MTGYAAIARISSRDVAWNFAAVTTVFYAVGEAIRERV